MQSGLNPDVSTVNCFLAIQSGSGSLWAKFAQGQWQQREKDVRERNGQQTPSEPSAVGLKLRKLYVSRPHCPSFCALRDGRSHGIMDKRHLIRPFDRNPGFLPILMLTACDHGRKRRGLHDFFGQMTQLHRGELDMAVTMMGRQVMFL
jgi:hypothetical protein